MVSNTGKTSTIDKRTIEQTRAKEESTPVSTQRTLGAATEHLGRQGCDELVESNSRRLAFIRPNP